MIKTKIIVKPKDGSSSSGSVTEGSYGSGYADYAASAGRAKQSDRSALATLAETAISAYRAKRADMASELDPDSETLQGYVLKEWLGKLLSVVDVDGTEQDINGTVGDGMKIMPHLDLTSIDVSGDGHISLGGMQMVYDAEHGAWRLDGSLYVTGGLSALGNSDVAGGGGGGLDAELLWSLLGNSGTEQISKSHLADALAGYATEEWVEGKGYLTEASLDGLKDNLKYVSNIVAGESVSAKDLLGADAVTVDYKEFYRETAIDFNSQRIEIVMDLSAVQRTGKETFVRLGKDIKNDHTILMELLHNDPTGRPKELWFSFIGFGISKRYVYNKLDYQDLLYFTIERGKITLNGTVIPSEYYSDDFFDLTSLQIGSRVGGCLTGVIYRKMDVVDKQHPEGLKLAYSYSDGEQKSVTLPVATNLSNGLLTSKEKRLLDIIPLQYATKKDLEKKEKFIANFSTVQIKDTMPILDRGCPFNPNNGIWQYQLHINYDYYKVEITFDISTCKNNEEEIFSFGESIASWNTGKPVIHLYYTKGNKTLKIDYLFGGTFSGESSLTRGTFTSESGVFAVVISKNKITVNGSELDLKNHYELFNIRDVYVGQVIKENKFCNATFSKVCMTKVDGASGVLVEYDYNHSDETSGNYLLTDATEDMSGLMSSADKKLLNQISHGTITNWNSVYNWYSEVTSGDTDKVINKWGEIIDFLSGIEDTASLSGIVDGINGAISNEVSRATKAENDISRSLIAEVERSVKKDDALTNSIAEEIGRAKGAEQTLTNNVSANTTAISDEVARAKGAENTISSNLTAEIDRSTKKDNELSKSITDEVIRAKAAEQTLTSSISTNTSAINVLKGYFTNGVAKSAVKLQTARKIWGNTFDGTQDVAGDLILPNGKKIVIGGASLSWDATNNAVKIDGSVYATGGLSALGNSDVAGGGGGLMGSIVPYAKAIALTVQNEGSEIASAWSVKMLYDKIETIDVSGQLTSYLTKQEAQTLYQPVGNYLTAHQSLDGYVNDIAVEGTGNAVTTVAKSGKTVIFTKGANYLTGITKAQVEGVLTGNITSHTHSQYLTAHQSLDGYVNDIAVEGTGNAVTTVAKSGKTVIFTKGANYLTGITKAQVEGVLTGNITSHTHSQYLTAHQSLDGYVNDIAVEGTGNAVTTVAKSGKTVIFTKGANYLTGITKAQVEGVLTGNITSHTHSQYLTSHQSLSGYATEAWVNAKGYITSSGSCTYATTSGSANSVAWGNISGKPTTLGGYGITDGIYHEQVGIEQDNITWFEDYAKAHTHSIIYNTHGNEYAYLINMRNDYVYGNILKIGYTDTYLRILRKKAGKWLSSDWEKISAGFADSAGVANSVAWSNVSGRPTSMPASDVYAWAKASSKPGYSWGEISGKPSTFAPSSHTHKWAEITDRITKVSQLSNDSGYITSSASISGNAGSATRLQTARTIWGQSFNGTGNVSGALSGVTTIAASGQVSVGSLKIGSVTITYDSTNKGLKIDGGGLYSTSYVSALGESTASGSSGGSSVVAVPYVNAKNLTTEDTSKVASAYSVAQLSSLITSNTTSISSLQSSMSGITNSIASLSKSVFTLEERVLSLENNSGGSGSIGDSVTLSSITGKNDLLTISTSNMVFPNATTFRTLTTGQPALVMMNLNGTNAVQLFGVQALQFVTTTNGSTWTRKNFNVSKAISLGLLT